MRACRVSNRSDNGRTATVARCAQRADDDCGRVVVSGTGLGGDIERQKQRIKLRQQDTLNRGQPLTLDNEVGSGRGTI